jgi:hypothetical protein
VPHRTLHEVGLVVRPWIRGVTVSATFENVGDLRVEHQKAPDFTGLERIPRALADYGGFPLPGWRFFVNVAWTFRDPKPQPRGARPSPRARSASPARSR